MAGQKHTTDPTQLDLSFDPAEEWRPVVGYEGLYAVSNLGRVKNVRPPTTRPTRRADGTPSDIRGGRIRTLSPNQRGYHTLLLSKDGVTRHHAVHTLVLEAFVGPRPEGYMCNHLDCDGTNNTLSNLSWVTAQENMTYMVSLGRSLIGEKNCNARLTAPAVQDIRRMYGEGMSYEQIAAQAGADRRTIRDVVTRRTWKHIP